MKIEMIITLTEDEHKEVETKREAITGPLDNYEDEDERDFVKLFSTENIIFGMIEKKYNGDMGDLLCYVDRMNIKGEHIIRKAKND